MRKRHFNEGINARYDEIHKNVEGDVNIGMKIKKPNRLYVGSHGVD